jgi:alcohol dehydrogenase
MKALVYHSPGKCALENMPKPDLKLPTDGIDKVTKMTICGTELHIMKGDVPTVTDGRILGHEGIGIVEQLETIEEDKLIEELLENDSLGG